MTNNIAEERDHILRDVLDLEYSPEDESWGYTQGQGDQEWFVSIDDRLIDNMVVGVLADRQALLSAQLDRLAKIAEPKSLDEMFGDKSLADDYMNPEWANQVQQKEGYIMLAKIAAAAIQKERDNL